jgi:hypothetical protein
MNTLHLCHWQNLNHFKEHLTLISANDCLVIFGHLSTQEKEQIHQVMQDYVIDWHLVKADNHPNINDPTMSHEITHDEWLKLVLQHNNSYAWK